MTFPYVLYYRDSPIRELNSLPQAVDFACTATTSPGNLAAMHIEHTTSGRNWSIAVAAHLCRQPIVPTPGAMSHFLPKVPTWFSVLPFPRPNIFPTGKWAAVITYHSTEPTGCFCIGDQPQRHFMFAPTNWQMSEGDWNLTATDFEGYDYFQPYAYPLDMDGARLQGVSGLTINHMGEIETVPWRGAMG